MQFCWHAKMWSKRSRSFMGTWIIQKAVVCSEPGTEASDEDSRKRAAHGAVAAEEVSSEAREEHQEIVMNAAHMQLVHASARMPKRARTTLAALPSARQDVEKGQVSLGDLKVIGQNMAGTQAPLTLRLMPHPASVSSIGMGLRTGTHRNKTYIRRRFFQFVTQAKLVTVPVPDDLLRLLPAQGR